MIRINLLGSPKPKGKKNSALSMPSFELGNLGGPFVQVAAVLLIAGEYERAVAKAGADKGPRVVNLEAGHVAENVLLQATALGLGAVPVAGFEPKDAQKAASLPAQHTPIYLMPIGHTD